MPFIFQQLEIPDIIAIESKQFHDSRGHFLELYKTSDFNHNGIPNSFVQTNYSFSTKGVLRGLHYQITPQAQGKLISITKGVIQDVVVDIRPDSPYFCKWISVELSPGKLLFIPPGFAHGFVVLSNEAHVLYSCTKEYTPKLDRGIRFDDPDLNINWQVNHPVLSQKDQQQPFLKSIDLSKERAI